MLDEALTTDIKTLTYGIKLPQLTYKMSKSKNCLRGNLGKLPTPPTSQKQAKRSMKATFSATVHITGPEARMH